MEYLTFSWIDYTLFVLLFGISSGIGVYYGWCKKQNQTTSEYLLGGKKMKIFPVSMSLVASTLSGITLLSVPAEVYVHGTQFMLLMITPIITFLVLNYIYLPIFWKLELATLFHYLEIRFDRRLRTTASFLFTLSTFLYLPIVIYAPSLAFNQVTGLNLHITAVVMSSICIFYTALGGMKAVCWTDTVQFCFTLCTLGCILIMGIASVGGIATIWNRADYGERLELFNIDPDPTIRNSFWTISVGLTITLVSFTVTNPGITQRFFAVPTLTDSKKVLKIYTLFQVITTGICCFTGLIVYAKYYKCDPLTSRQITKADQILPFYVMDVAEKLPGLGGLFVAGLFSTALSTLSTSLNALSGIIYQDFVSPFLPSDVSEKKASNSMKIITVLLGVLSVAVVFVIDKLGTVVELASSLNGCTLGPLLGIFTLGTMFPTSKKKGVLAGALMSLLIMLAITVNYQVQVWNGNIKYKSKPLHTYGCNESSQLVTTTTSASIYDQSEDFNWFYNISVHYYVPIGMLLTLVIGWLVSYFTKNDEKDVNSDTLCPLIPRLFTKFNPPVCCTYRKRKLDISCNSTSVNNNKEGIF